MQTYQLEEASVSETRFRRLPRNEASGGYTYRKLFGATSSSSSHADFRTEVVEAAPDRFAEYEAYDISDWDGYGAEPICAATVAWARTFYGMLPRGHRLPDVAPGADGTIGFEWAINQDGDRQYVFVDIGPNGRFRARRVSADGALIEAWPAVGIEGLLEFVEPLARLLR